MDPENNSENNVRKKYQKVKNSFGEKQKRLWAATEALSIGYGGVSVVHRATGLSRSTIQFGIKELQEDVVLKNPERARRSGGGRKKIEADYPILLEKLQKLIEDHTRGDPMRALLWTCKSTENLSIELKKMGYDVSDRTVARLLHDLDYSLQSNRKSLEGKQSPERDAQFQYINTIVQAFQKKGQPVISVDIKKKELVGNFKNSGQEWHPEGMPTHVKVHDFVDENGERVKAIPYGIYDVTWNAGWVNVGIDHDTAEFAVQSIRNWWKSMAQEKYAQAASLLITADSGGSNSSRGRLWKSEIQKLADETGIQITVCHLPPGTSKWNKVEHRLFCHITRNWRARPLISYEVIVNLISNTKTKAGLKVSAVLDENKYALAKKVSNADMKGINIKKHEINEKWNYTISPRKNLA